MKNLKDLLTEYHKRINTSRGQEVGSYNITLYMAKREGVSYKTMDTILDLLQDES